MSDPERLARLLVPVPIATIIAEMVADSASVMPVEYLPWPYELRGVQPEKLGVMREHAPDLDDSARELWDAYCDWQEENGTRVMENRVRLQHLCFYAKLANGVERLKLEQVLREGWGLFAIPEDHSQLMAAMTQAIVEPENLHISARSRAKRRRSNLWIVRGQ